MKGHLEYFVHVIVGHHEGLEVLKYTLEMPFWIPLHAPSSPCLILLQCSSLLSMLGPSLVISTIYFRQHHILMNIRIIPKKRNYLII